MGLSHSSLMTMVYRIVLESMKMGNCKKERNFWRDSPCGADSALGLALTARSLRPCPCEIKISAPFPPKYHYSVHLTPQTSSLRLLGLPVDPFYRVPYLRHGPWQPARQSPGEEPEGPGWSGKAPLYSLPFYLEELLKKTY